jgi:hypothetical protein
MKTILLLAGLALCARLPAIGAVPLTESTFTEIIRVANVVSATNQAVAAARTNEVFRAPDLVRTGDASRIEMTAPDQTITRVGANTTFTFAPGGRDLLLRSGSVLFHAPAGVGGGAVKYHGTSAAVLGTTMICTVLPGGRFKVLDLEGHVLVTLKTQQSVTLKAGQMVLISADGTQILDEDTFLIAEVIGRLVLMVEFSEPLSSLPLIEAAIQEQNAEIAAGTLPTPVSFTVAVFGLDIIYVQVDPGLPHPPETPDHTMLPASPD